MDKAISADIKVLEYLSEKVGDRKTKMEAYLDLMYKANDGFVSPFLRKKESDLGPCQCHASLFPLPPAIPQTPIPLLFTAEIVPATCVP